MCKIEHWMSVWWMSGVVDVWCRGCLKWWILHTVWWIFGIADVLFYTQCGGYLVWWMSGVMDVCVVDVFKTIIHVYRVYHVYHVYHVYQVDNFQ